MTTQIEVTPTPTTLPTEVTVVVTRDRLIVEDGIGTLYTPVSDDGVTAVFKGTVDPIHGDFLTITSSGVDAAETTLEVIHPPVKKERTFGTRDRSGRPNPWGGPVVIEYDVAGFGNDLTKVDLGGLIKAIAAAKATKAYAAVLRLNGGMGESAAAKTKFGSVTLSDPQGVRPSFTTVNFTNPLYLNRVRQINDAVASVIEDDDFIREMFMWWCGTEFSVEWPILNASLAANRTAWLRAGYNQQEHIAMILGSPALFAESFKRTLFATFMPMGFQRFDASGVKQDMTVNTAFLDAVVLHQSDGVLGVDNADLASYGPNRPSIYTLAKKYHDEHGLARTDQTVITVKMQGGAPGVQKFFGQANLVLAIADGVYCIEHPRGSGMTVAQFTAANKQLTDAGATNP